MIGNTHNVRTCLVFSLFLGFGLFLLYHLFSLQCLRHRDYASLAELLHRKVNRVQPRRGAILDFQGSVLATSVPSLSLFAVPREIKHPAETASALAPTLQCSRKDLEEKFSRGGEYVRLKRDLSETEVAAIKSLSLPGINFETGMKRVYPKGKLLSHVLGFTDPDGNGLEGLELKYDLQLRGHPGWRVSEKDSKQREVFWFRRQDLPPLDGCNLVLTVDELIQNIAEEELERVVEKYRALWASLIVMEPTTGNILALVNCPTFDPNLAAGSPPDCRRNRAVIDTLEPGSTFKVFPAAVALELEIVDLDTPFYCENGCFRTAQYVLHDHRPHGTLNFEEVIQKSSNIGMAKVGILIGESKLYRLLKAFRIGDRTGVDLPGESPGLLRVPQQWSKLSLSRITMGHEVALTPLGLLTSFCALGNQGVVPKPRIVDRIEDASGEVIYRFPQEVFGRAVSGDTSRKMVFILKKAVQEGGTGNAAAIEGFEVAGKTGTAQKTEPGGGYSHDRFRALFLGLLPANQPRFAILVVVDEPQGDYYGGVVAAPVFRRVAERLIRYYNLQPSEQGVLL